MTPRVWINPRRDTVATAIGTVNITQVDLGGIPRGAVLVLTAGSDFGHHVATLLNELAEHGYESVAADMTSAGRNDDTIRTALAELLTHVGKRGWHREQTGVIGYGCAGRLALLAASQFTLGAAVSVSPRNLFGTADQLFNETTALASRIRTPWLVMFGENDPWAPDAARRELERTLRSAAPAYTQIVCYPGVGGDFYRKSRESFEIAASYDCRQRILEWLNLRVAPRLTPRARAWRQRQAAS